MTKAEIIEKMAKDAEISKKDAANAYEALIDSVIETLKTKKRKKKNNDDDEENDDEVRLVGFGTFYKSHRKARTGRNPQTGETIKIKATNVVKFRASKKLRDVI